MDKEEIRHLAECAGEETREWVNIGNVVEAKWAARNAWRIGLSVLGRRRSKASMERESFEAEMTWAGRHGL